MKIIFSTLCATVLVLSPLAVGSAGAASLTPLPPNMMLDLGSQASELDNLVEAQYTRRYQQPRRGADRRGPPRRGYNTYPRRVQPQRPSPPRSQGPDLGSAIVGAIIGGIIVDQVQRPRQHQQPRAQHGSFLSHNHINWCNNRWRSYRVSDNSYQPYNGPRRLCVSPYGPS